jgi:hypothetical protein
MTNIIKNNPKLSILTDYWFDVIIVQCSTLHC